MYLSPIDESGQMWAIPVDPLPLSAITSSAPTASAAIISVVVIGRISHSGYPLRPIGSELGSSECELVNFRFEEVNQAIERSIEETLGSCH